MTQEAFPMVHPADRPGRACLPPPAGAFAPAQAVPALVLMQRPWTLTANTPI